MSLSIEKELEKSLEKALESAGYEFFKIKVELLKPGLEFVTRVKITWNGIWLDSIYSYCETRVREIEKDIGKELDAETISTEIKQCIENSVEEEFLEYYLPSLMLDSGKVKITAETYYEINYNLDYADFVTLIELEYLYLEPHEIAEIVLKTLETLFTFKHL